MVIWLHFTMFYHSVLILSFYINGIKIDFHSAEGQLEKIIPITLLLSSLGPLS